MGGKVCERVERVSKVEIKFASKFFFRFFSTVKHQKGEKVVTSGVDLFGSNNFETGRIRNLILIEKLGMMKFETIFIRISNRYLTLNLKRLKRGGVWSHWNETSVYMLHHHDTSQFILLVQRHVQGLEKMHSKQLVSGLGEHL